MVVHVQESLEGSATMTVVARTGVQFADRDLQLLTTCMPIGSDDHGSDDHDVIATRWIRIR